MSPEKFHVSTKSSTLLAPPELFHRYAYRGELGRGRSGRVLVVEDTQSAELRALKVVSAARAGWLAWELDLLSAVVDPHVARVFELLRVEHSVGEPFHLSAGDAVLVEELAYGVPSADRVASIEPEGRVRELLRIGQGVAQGLAALHARGIVHGDIKPDNLIVAEDRVWIVDLGMGHLGGVSMATGGTPAFMAPEAWEGQRTAATDLFALGATLLSLVQGRHDHGWTAEDIQSYLRRSYGLHRAAASLELPESLRAMLVSLLDPNPLCRPPSALGVAAELAELAGDRGAPVSGVRDHPADRAAALQTVSWVGDAERTRALDAALATHRVVEILGPRGAGRGRWVHDAVRRMQRQRFDVGEVVPTYCESARLPSGSVGSMILYLRSADRIDLGDVLAWVDARETAGAFVRVLLERSETSGRAPALELGPLRDEHVAELLKRALSIQPSAELIDAAKRFSGALAGKLVRGLVEGVREGVDLRRPAALRSLRLGGVASIPAAAQALAEVLAIGAGPMTMEELAGLSGARLLLQEGLATLLDSSELCLRSDLIEQLFDAMPSAHREARARELLPRLSRPRALASALALLGRETEAASQFVIEIRRLRAAGDPEAAEEVARRALRLVDDEGELLVALADALRAQGRYRAALSELRSERRASVGDGSDAARLDLLEAELRRLAGEPVDSAALAALASRTDSIGLRAFLLQGRMRLDAGAIDEAEAIASAAASRISMAAGEDGDRGEELPFRARVSELETLIELARGDADKALAAAERGRTSALRSGDVALQARAEALVGSALTLAGRSRPALDAHGRAAELAAMSGERHAQASFQANRGLAAYDVGEVAVARSALQEAALTIGMLGRQSELGRVLYNLGNLQWTLGDRVGAARSVERAYRAASETHDRATSVCSSLVLMEERAYRGKLDKAAELGDRAVEEAVDAPALVRISAHARRATRYAAEHSLEDARADLEAARSSLKEAGELGTIEWAIARAHLALHEGDASRAIDAALEAEQRARALGVFEPSLRALLTLFEVAEACGRAEVAQRAATEARALLDRVAGGLAPSDRHRLRHWPRYEKVLARAGIIAGRSEGVDGRAGAYGSEGAERWRRLAEAMLALGAERRVGRLYELLLRLALELVGAERGFVVLVQGDGSHGVRASMGLDRLAAGGIEDLSRSLLSAAMSGGAIVTTTDAMSEEAFSALASIHALSLRSVLVAPLRCGNRVIGALYLDDRLRAGAFGSEDEVLMERLMKHAASVLDLAERLRDEKKRRRRDLLHRRRLEQEVELQQERLETFQRAEGDEPIAGMVVASEPMRELVTLARRVARSSAPTLIRGESGTGKELLARLIHDRSPRSNGPFVAESCGALPETLLESALFGHVRGAFTGADRSHAGLFEAADGGTLFLDEVGEMSAALQTKLLRVLQEGEVRPVGGERAKKVDVRVVAATHRDLESMVGEGLFREDLYYRLAVFVLQAPPLRERIEELPTLIGHFVDRHGEGRALRFTDDALAAMMEHHWPGNLRQLENEVRRLLVLVDDAVRPEHLSFGGGRPQEGGALDLDLRAHAARLERRLINEALTRTEGNQTEAAELLGLSRFGLQKKMRRLAISVPKT